MSRILSERIDTSNVWCMCHIWVMWHLNELPAHFPLTISLHALQNPQNNTQEETFEIRIPHTLDHFSFSSRLLLQRTKTSTKTWQNNRRLSNQINLMARLHPCHYFHEFFIWCMGQQSTGGNEAKQQRSANTSHSISIATQNKEHKEMLLLQTSTRQTQTERHS